MPQPKKNAPKRRQRKKRTYKHLEKAERATYLRGIADTKRVERVPHELQLGQLNLIPEEERPDGAWESQVEAAEKALANLDAEVKAAEDQANALVKPPTAAERKAREEAVRSARRERLKEQLAGWERTMLGHEAHLSRLEVVPEADREGYEEEGARSWERVWEENEDALDVLERAVEAGGVLLEAAGPEPDGADG